MTTLSTLYTMLREFLICFTETGGGEFSNTSQNTGVPLQEARVGKRGEGFQAELQVQRRLELRNSYAL